MVSLAHPPPSTQSEPSAQSELSAQPEQSTPPDPSVPKPSEHSDPPIFIGVMGLTGTGKSAFIRTLTGDEEIKVGHGLTSCTKKIQSSQMMVGNHRVFLIDTPGFDDTYISDIDLLTSIGDWLKTSDDEKCHLSGLIYLHRISDDRVGGVARRSLTMMRNLLGDDNLQNLVLVTNRWEEVDNRIGEAKERELIGPNGFWEPMVKRGSTVMRYDGERETAEDIINTIVGRAPFVTQFQMERREGKNIEATSAGEGLITELQRRVDKLQNIVEKLQAELTEEMRKNTAATEALRKSHKEDVQDLKNELKSSREAQENLRKYLKSWWWRRWGWW